MTMNQLGSQLYKLERKFNLLTAWLQVKFPNDSTFPQSFGTEASTLSPDFEYKPLVELKFTKNELKVSHKSESLDSNPTIMTSRRSKRTLRKKARASTARENDDASSETPKQSKLPPCFVHLIRLKVEQDSDDSYVEEPAPPEYTSSAVNRDPLSLSNTSDIVEPNFDLFQNEKTEFEESPVSPATFQVENSDSESNLSTRNIVKATSQKTGPLISCPLCKQSCTRRYISTHIRKYHQAEATPQFIRKLKQSLITKDKIPTPGPSSVKIRAERKKYKRKKAESKKIPHCCPVCQLSLTSFTRCQIHIEKCHPTVFEEKVKSGEFIMPIPPPPTEGALQEAPLEPGTSKCDICGKTVMTINLLAHIDRMHNTNSSLLCSICGYKTNRKHGLSCHMLTHSAERSFKCNACPFTAKHYQGVRMHFRRAHDTARFMRQCYLCGELFRGPSALAKHISQVHNNERRFQCPRCDKAFKSKTHLDYHVKTHDNPNGRKRGLNKEREVKRRKPNSSTIQRDATKNDVPENAKSNQETSENDMI